MLKIVTTKKGTKLLAKITHIGIGAGGHPPYFVSFTDQQALTRTAYVQTCEFTSRLADCTP